MFSICAKCQLLLTFERSRTKFKVKLPYCRKGEWERGRGGRGKRGNREGKEGKGRTPRSTGRYAVIGYKLKQKAAAVVNVLLYVLLHVVFYL